MLFVTLVDALLLTSAALLALQNSVEPQYQFTDLTWYLITLPTLIALPIFLRIGLYRSIIRYIGDRALWTITQGVTLTTLGWTLILFLLQSSGQQTLPYTVPLLFWFIALVLITLSRFGVRWLLWLPLRRRFSNRQVLIYGAGSAGRQLAASLRRGSELFPAGFLDDNPALQGHDIDNLRVYPPRHLTELIRQFDIRDVIVTLPNTSSARRREVVARLEPYPVRVRILPAVSDIANGRHLVNMVREVDIGDLLGRDPVEADPMLLQRCISDRVVLVTGAGGSIGSELCHQIAALQPKKLILLDANEYALYQIERRLRNISSIALIPILGSILDDELLAQLINREQITTIYHAAAHKHVPLVESNVCSAVRNNIFGTLRLATAAAASGVTHLMLISSDKAVRPTNVMGATKRWSELIIQSFAAEAAAQQSGQHFSAVRFGNVLGSSGSVIPLFREQIARGGPITVTHADVTRYFMSIHEAVELVIQATSMARGGDIFLLDMGEPVKIMTLARNMIRLAGYTPLDLEHPNGDIEIRITGLRPGEKLYEELLIDPSHAHGTEHPRIMTAMEPALAPHQLRSALQQLDSNLTARDDGSVREIVMKLSDI